MIRKLTAMLAAVVAATLVTAPTATAGTVRNGLSCQAGIYGWQEAFNITVNAPATARQGDTVTLTGSVTGTIARSGPRPAGSYAGQLQIKVVGGTTSWVTMAGMSSPAANDGDPFALTGGSAQVTLDTVGTVTLNPGSASWWVAANPTYGWTCFDPDGNLPTAASIQVLPR